MTKNIHFHETMYSKALILKWAIGPVQLQYLLFEVGFVLVLLLQLLGCGMVGEHTASGKLRCVHVGKT